MPYCASCGSEVSTDAAACPRCGHPQHARSPATAVRRNDGTAVASLVLGIVGLVMCPLIPSIVAVVLGNQAKQRIAADPALEGESLARAGTILGWVGIGIYGTMAVIMLLFVLAGMAMTTM